MMFAGLDIKVGDVVVIEMVNSRTCQLYSVIGEITRFVDINQTKRIKIETKNRPMLITERWVKRIAFLNEEPPLLINI